MISSHDDETPNNKQRCVIIIYINKTIDHIHLAISGMSGLSPVLQQGDAVLVVEYDSLHGWAT